MSKLNHKYDNYIRDENKNLLPKISLTAFFTSSGFTPEKYIFNLEFWLELNSLDEETLFIVDDDTITMFGYKSNKEGDNNERKNFFRMIKKHFRENDDYKITVHKRTEILQRGNPNYSELEMTKTTFKLACLLAKTEKSTQIYKFLLDLEKYVTEYIVYEKEYAESQIVELELKKPLLEMEQTDVSMYRSISMSSYNGIMVLYLFYLENYHALKFGITNQLSERAKRHFCSFGSKNGDVMLIHVIATEHATDVENSLRTCVLEKGWKLENVVIHKKVQTELIDLTKTTIPCIIDLINSFIKQHIVMLKSKEDAVVSKYNLNIDLEKIRLQSKLADLEMKKIDAGIEIKKIDLEIKRMDFEEKKYDFERNVKQRTS